MLTNLAMNYSPQKQQSTMIKPVVIIHVTPQSSATVALIHTSLDFLLSRHSYAEYSLKAITQNELLKEP